MTLRPDASLIDVAFAACTALDRAMIVAVLTGGSAATFYAPVAYQSLDVDLILRYGVSAHDVDDALREIGFTRDEGGYYAHPHIPFTVEFPAGPLQIGSDLVTSWATEHRGDELVHILTPTDVVRDRFLRYYAYRDVSAYNVAVQIGRAMRDRVNWSLFEEWARREAANDRSYDLAGLSRYLNAAGR